MCYVKISSGIYYNLLLYAYSACITIFTVTNIIKTKFAVSGALKCFDDGPHNILLLLLLIRVLTCACTVPVQG